MKIILLGPNGMLGHYLKIFLNQHYKVITVDRNQLDALDTNIIEIDQLMKQLECDKDTIILNCIGIIPQRRDLIDTLPYIRVNAEFPHLINAVSQKYSAKFIHITTDCVYDGKKGRYSESDQATEKNIYGLSKSLGEPQSAMVIRTSIIGEERSNKKSLLEWVKSQNGKTIKGFDNHFWNGVTCLQLAKIIHQIISLNLYWNGVRHIYSPRSISKYELIEQIIKEFDLNIEVVRDQTKDSCDKTLTSIYTINEIFNIPDLNEQIKNLRSFSHYFI